MISFYILVFNLLFCSPKITVILPDADFYTSLKWEIFCPNTKVKEYSGLSRSRVYILDTLILSRVA